MFRAITIVPVRWAAWTAWAVSLVPPALFAVFVDGPKPSPARPPRPLQVLVVEDAPRWEYRYQRMLLERADTGKARQFAPRVMLLGADPLVAHQDRLATEALPVRGELDHFDLVILGDVDPADQRLGKDHLQNLARFVKDGGGLLVVAGPRHTPHALKGTPLEAVLPIELGDQPMPKEDRKNGYRPVLTEAARKHPAWQFNSDPKASERVWNGLAEMYWFAEGYRAKPGAETLATHPTAGDKGRPHPLIVQEQVGKGKALFIGFDETWRWRRNEGVTHHRTFWAGVWRSLAGSVG